MGVGRRHCAGLYYLVRYCYHTSNQRFTTFYATKHGCGCRRCKKNALVLQTRFGGTNGCTKQRNTRLNCSPKHTALRFHIDQNLFLLKQLGGAQQKRLFHGKQACDTSSALCEPRQQRQRYFGPSTSRNSLDKEDCGPGKTKVSKA